MEIKIQKFKQEIQRVAPKLNLLWGNCATKEMIQKAENSIGQSLPPSLKQLYLKHNGQSGCKGLFLDWIFLSLEDMVFEWQKWKEVAEEVLGDLDDDSISVPRGYIKELYVSPGWIPFGKDGGGNNFAIDLDPDTEGSIGQVIVFGRDYDTKFVLANRLEEFFDHYIKRLKSNEFKEDYKEQYLYVEPPQIKIAQNENSQDEFKNFKESLDPNWEEYLNNKVGNIDTLEQLENIHYLHLSKDIDNLLPIVHFKDLRELIATGTKIESVEPLSEVIYLKSLILAKTPIKDLKGICKCKNLTYLSLYDTKISDIKELKNLTSLKELCLENTDIKSLSEVSTLLKLTSLNLNQTSISSLDDIKDCKKLVELKISETKVDNLSFISNFKKLESIEIYRLKIQDYTPLIECTHINNITCEYELFDILKNILPYKPNFAIAGGINDEQKKIWMQYCFS